MRTAWSKTPRASARTRRDDNTLTLDEIARCDELLLELDREI